MFFLGKSRYLIFILVYRPTQRVNYILIFTDFVSTQRTVLFIVDEDKKLGGLIQNSFDHLGTKCNIILNILLLKVIANFIFGCQNDQAGWALQNVVGILKNGFTVKTCLK